MNFTVFVRFLAEKAGDKPVWRPDGVFLPYVKYFMPEGRIVVLSERPSLFVTEQRNAGTGLSSTGANLFDLSLPKLEPVLTYMADGHRDYLQQTVAKEIRGAIASFETGPPEVLRIRYTAKFYVGEYSPEPAIELGSLHAQAAYLRATDGKFKFDREHSSASKKTIQRVYEDFDPDLSGREFVNYNFENLRRIASGTNHRAKQWLSTFLAMLPSDPQVQRLRSLLR